MCPPSVSASSSERLEGIALGPLVDRQLLGELAGAAGEVADDTRGLIELRLGRGHDLSGLLDGRPGVVLSALQRAGHGLDLGSQLLGRREALEPLHVFAGPHGQLALEGTDGALRHLQGLGRAVDLGLGRSQVVLQGGPPLFDRGELDAVLFRSHVGVIVVGFVRVRQRVRQEEVARRVVQGHPHRVHPDRGQGVDQRCPHRLGDRPMGPKEREDGIAGIDAEEVGDLVEQPGALGDEVVDLGGVTTGDVERVEGELGVVELSFHGGTSWVADRRAAPGEDDVQVATEAVSIEQLSLGGLGLLELAARSPATPAPTDVLLGFEDSGVGGVELERAAQG